MLRSYEELKKYIYIDPNRLFDKRVNVNEFNKDCICREITLKWYGDSSSIETCLIKYEWHPWFASEELPNKKNFPNSIEYYKEMERLARSCLKNKS